MRFPFAASVGIFFFFFKVAFKWVRELAELALAEISQRCCMFTETDASTRQFGGQTVCVLNGRRYRCSRLFLLAADLGKKIESERYTAERVASTSLRAHTHIHTQ